MGTKTLQGNYNPVSRLIELVTEVPLLYVLGTASRQYPEATAQEILKDIHSSPNPRETALEKYGLLELFDKREQPIGFSKEDLIQHEDANYLALCPFHLDTNLGSFVIAPGKGVWSCFAEGLSGNAIVFEREYYGLGFVDSVYHLAYRLGFISQSAYKNKSSQILEAHAMPDIGRITPREQKVYKVAPPHIVHNVYMAMQKVCPLSEEDRTHLLEERKLDVEDLENYFTFPARQVDLYQRVMDCITDTYIANRFHKKKEELTPEEVQVLEDSQALAELRREFMYVPGFYYDRKKEKIAFVSYTGIGLFAKDDTGRVVGIQVRARQNGKQSKGFRYVWFSSAFAQGNEAEYAGGASPGAPGGIIFPKDKPLQETALCITEGRFKAEQIAKEGNVVVYVSGVNSWRSIMPMIERVKGNRRNVYVLYDADMMGNIPVHGQLYDLSQGLKEKGLTPYLIVWRKEYGKGFDDFKIANPHFKSLLNTIPFDVFEDVYADSLNVTLKAYGIKRHADLDRKLADEFTEHLQTQIEGSLDLPIETGCQEGSSPAGV